MFCNVVIWKCFPTRVRLLYEYSDFITIPNKSLCPARHPPVGLESSRHPSVSIASSIHPSVGVATVASSIHLSLGVASFRHPFSSSVDMINYIINHCTAYYSTACIVLYITVLYCIVLYVYLFVYLTFNVSFIDTNRHECPTTLLFSQPKVYTRLD